MASRRQFLKTAAGAAALPKPAPIRARQHGGVCIEPSASTTGLKEVVLFAFDPCAIPFRRGLALHLVSGRKESPGGTVLGLGKPGDIDERVHFYGTIREVDGEFRMWYIGRQGLNENFINMEGRNGRVCYATSRDGVHWVRPKLGLLEFNGSKDNNGVLIRGLEGKIDMVSAAVLYDPEDPDPKRRFKMTFQGKGFAGTGLCVAYSRDGLDWTPSRNNPVGPPLELTGLMKKNGCCFATCHADHGEQFGPYARRLCTYCSYDFETWVSAPAISLDRSPKMMGPAWEGLRNRWEEVHQGAGLWDRGNVILGFYGMWHGAESGDRRYVTMDIGLILSYDGLNYDEPISGFPIVQAAEEKDDMLGFGPSIVPGQAFANVGEETYHWYSLWRRVGQVRLARWGRDRLGYVQMFRFKTPGQLVSCPIHYETPQARLYVNADGLGEHSHLQIELLDLQFRPVPGFSDADCLPVNRSGLRVPVTWRKGERLPKDLKTARLRMNFAGLRPEDIRFYAAYVSDEELL